MAKKSFTAVAYKKTPNSNSVVFEKVNSIVKSTASPLQVIVNSGNQQQHSIPGATVNFMAGYVF